MSESAFHIVPSLELTSLSVSFGSDFLRRARCSFWNTLYGFTLVDDSDLPDDLEDDLLLLPDVVGSEGVGVSFRVLELFSRPEVVLRFLLGIAVVSSTTLGSIVCSTVSVCRASSQELYPFQ